MTASFQKRRDLAPSSACYHRAWSVYIMSACLCQPVARLSSGLSRRYWYESTNNSHFSNSRLRCSLLREAHLHRIAMGALKSSRSKHQGFDCPMAASRSTIVKAHQSLMHVNHFVRPSVRRSPPMTHIATTHLREDEGLGPESNRA